MTVTFETLPSSTSEFLSSNSIYRASVVYLHEGDWTVNLDGVERERMTLTCNYYKTFESQGLDFEIVDVSCASKREYKTLFREIYSNPRIRRIAFLRRLPEKGRQAYRLGLVGDYGFSVYALLEHADAIFMGSRYYEGVEVWDFISPSEYVTERVTHGLLRMGSILKVDLRKIGFPELEALLLRPRTGLSARELETLRHAFQTGYFEWPRRVTLKDIADHFKISKSTINECMRKAVKKILNGYLQYEQA